MFAIGNMSEKVNITISLLHRIFCETSQLREIKYFPDTLSNLDRLHILPRTAHVAPPLENPIFMGRNEPLSNIVVTRGNVRCGPPFRHLHSGISDVS